MTAFAKTIVVRLRAYYILYEYSTCVYLRARRIGRFLRAYYDIFIHIYESQKAKFQIM